MPKSVFVTGATGWIGSAVAVELLREGYRVVGLARSDESAAKLEAAGIGVRRGSIEDLESLRAAAAAADAVVHLAFNHDFSRFAQSGAEERDAIDAIAWALEGTTKPLALASGVAFLPAGRLVTEDDNRDASVPFPRDPETAAAAAAARGVHVSVIRFAPSVHGAGEYGFVPLVIGIARERGVSPYVGDGQNHWPAVHRDDAARLTRLAIERAAPHAVYHAVAEEGIPFRSLAEVIGRRLQLPVTSISKDEAELHFGGFARFAAIDVRASNAKTREALGWQPTRPGLLEDVEGTTYFA